MAPLEGTGRYESQKKTLVADGTPDLPYRTIEIRIFFVFLRRRRIVKFCFETSRCDGQSSAGGGNQVGGQLPVCKNMGSHNGNAMSSGTSWVVEKITGILRKFGIFRGVLIIY